MKITHFKDYFLMAIFIFIMFFVSLTLTKLGMDQDLNFNSEIQKTLSGK
jgi:hypothetical protein